LLTREGLKRYPTLFSVDLAEDPTRNCEARSNLEGHAQKIL
jgi:hypothetical protein